MFKHLTLILSLLLLTSCTVISVIPIGESGTGINQNTIAVYANRDNIVKSFDEIAIISAKVDTEFGVVNDEELMDKILKEAQLIGANAVIFEEEDSHSIRVTAIKFTE